jgi:methylenetetrahydrofolate reductase (NADPH)
LSFEVICEVAPPPRPDLALVREQVGALEPVASAFLVPDNHLGRPTVSSIAVAHEVQQAVGVGRRRVIACLNARDRNVLGFQRDLLTAAAYGVERLLLVRGDDTAPGGRRAGLTVRQLLGEARAAGGGVEAGVTTRLTRLAHWKRDADFLFVQLSFSATALLRWRDTIQFDGPVYAGVVVLASAAMARRLAAATSEIDVPPRWIEACDVDPGAGVELAVQLVHELEETGAFDGVHLVPGARYRDVARKLCTRGSVPPKPRAAVALLETASIA